MLNGLSNVLNNTVIQETSFLLMVSFFSISVQDCLSMNNWKLSNPLFFYTNFIFLILLTHSSLTNSPTALLLFFFSNMVCFDYIFPTTMYRILSQNDLRSFPSVSLFTFWVHPLTPISFVYVCPLHDVITEEVDSTRRHAGLSLLLLFFVIFFIYLTCLRIFLLFLFSL